MGTYFYLVIQNYVCASLMCAPTTQNLSPFIKTCRVILINIRQVNYFDSYNKSSTFIILPLYYFVKLITVNKIEYVLFNNPKYVIYAFFIIILIVLL